MTNRANPRPALGLGLPAEGSVARCGVSWQKHKAGNNAAIQTAKGATNADCLSIGFFILTPGLGQSRYQSASGPVSIIPVDRRLLDQSLVPCIVIRQGGAGASAWIASPASGSKR